MTVKIINNRYGVDVEGSTKGDGSYSVTFISTDMVKAAMSGDVLTCDVIVMADGASVVDPKYTKYTLSTDEVVARRAVDVNIKTTLTAAPSNLIVVSGAISNPDGTPAAAGVQVRVTLGSNATRNLTTSGAGTYITTFFSSAAPVVAVHDTLSVKALDRKSGSAANTSMEIASHHVIAQLVEFPVTLIADAVPPVARVEFGHKKQKFVEPMENVDFIGSGSTDNITDIITGDMGIDTYMWDFGDGNTADTADTTHGYARPGKYTATLTVMDLAGNEDSASIDVFVGTVRLGGLSLNTMHARDVIDHIIGMAIAGTDAAQTVGVDALLAEMRSNPAMQQAVLKAIDGLLPGGMLLVPKQLLDAELPLVFADYENVDLENFGNALTARPTAGGILDSHEADVLRLVNGDKLDLYLAVPRADVGSVTFRLDGAGDRMTEVGTHDAAEVTADGSFPPHLPPRGGTGNLPAAVMARFERRSRRVCLRNPALRRAAAALSESAFQTAAAAHELRQRDAESGRYQRQDRLDG